MTLVLRYAARSDRGLVRSNNQDSVYAGPRLLALADGMGGHAAGEVASKVVIASLAPLDEDEPGDDLLTVLGDAVTKGNSAISELVAGDPDLDGMGTTLTAMLFAGSKLGMVHIGDSRAYLLRDASFTQITRDDSFVNELIEQGKITEDQAETHPQRSLLLKALTGNEIEPSLTVREARAGDRYLICSDGLSGMVSNDTMREAMQIPTPQECADRMIELALKGGGTDNVTVLIADVVDVEFGDDDPIVGGAAGDGSDDNVPQGDSPAARARALSQPAPQRIEPQPPDALPDEHAQRGRKRRKRVKISVGVVLVLILVGAAAIVTRYFVMQQFYVGVGTDSEVVVYRGVHGSILGIDMHEVAQRSCPPENTSMCEPLQLTDLQQSARNAVSAGVPRKSIGSAEEYIDTLRVENVLDYCDSGKTNGGSGNKGADKSGTSAAESSGSASESTTTKSGGKSSKQPDEDRDDQQPGVDCRPVSAPGGG